MRTRDVKGLWEAARRFAERVAPLVVGHEVETRGYVPVFIDATGIEVDGELFERARKDWEGRRGYWLHAVFLGGLWAAGQLCPGGGRVTLNWRTLLEWTAGPGLNRKGKGAKELAEWKPDMNACWMAGRTVGVRAAWGLAVGEDNGCVDLDSALWRKTLSLIVVRQ